MIKKYSSPTGVKCASNCPSLKLSIRLPFIHRQTSNPFTFSWPTKYLHRTASQQPKHQGDRIIAAAEIADVDAIHPGYGFLRKMLISPSNAKSVTSNSLVPVPTPSSTLATRQRPRNGGQSQGSRHSRQWGVSNDKDALAVAKKIGFPVIIKAVPGAVVRACAPPTTRCLQKRIHQRPQ